MTPQQMEEHEEYAYGVARLVHKWRTMKFLSETDRRRLLLMLSKMRMVCDSTYILDQKSRYDTKVDEAINIIRNVTESGNEKVVLFSEWERMARLVAQELEKAGIGYEYLHGGVPASKRKEMMDNFNENPDVRVFISTNAGSTGLNLQTASYLINMDLPWNPAVLEQRIGRIYRIGQKNNIQVINLVSIGTIEEQMLSKLHFKSSMFEGALDGGNDEVLLEGGKLQKIVEEFDFSPSEQKTDIEYITEEAVDTVGDNIEKTPDILSNDTEENICTIDNIAETANPVKPATEDKADAATDVIQKGVSFITDLVDVLKDPQASRKMVDTLVKEDKETGQVSLNIPVKDKETVMQFVGLLGKLLGQ